MINYEKIKKYIIYLTIFALSLIIAFLFFKYLFFPLSPFIFSYLIITITRPIVRWISKKTSIPIKLSSILFCTVCICILSLIIYFLLGKLLSEMVSLASFMTSGKIDTFLENLSDKIQNFLESSRIISKNSNLSKIISQKIQSLDTIIVRFAKDYYPQIAGKLINILKIVPNCAIFLFFTFISMFYVGYDFEKINEFFTIQFSKKAKNIMINIKNVFLSTLSDLFRAYFLITFITFTQLLIGFLILRVKYAWILAIIIALIDMLPILGTGTVLIPWSVANLIFGNTKMCVGILVLYGTITLVRQILEPKIVSSSTGLHPLLSLIAIYCGIRLFGFYGIFILPVTIIVLKSLNDRGIIHIYNNIPRKSTEIIQESKKKLKDIKKSK